MAETRELSREEAEATLSFDEFELWLKAHEHKVITPMPKLRQGDPIAWAHRSNDLTDRLSKLHRVGPDARETLCLMPIPPAQTHFTVYSSLRPCETCAEAYHENLSFTDVVRAARRTKPATVATGALTT